MPSKRASFEHSIEYRPLVQPARLMFRFPLYFCNQYPKGGIVRSMYMQNIPEQQKKANVAALRRSFLKRMTSKLSG
jgi:hypothetical protein